MTTPLRIEARRSQILWLAPVLAGTHIALTAADLGVWRMSCPMAVLYAAVTLARHDERELR
ncbi:hypothetical protein D5R93_03975 [Actinomyces lilanjuaniae]|uniref:Uncharacterized protein n=1 Tax=Actinomyces lilanjuaniae TaxID=2321394 RepID=A0ABN5PMC9_9ACTO|nr:hypothetical protein [Actinomyces lilanjuaniae]AYD89427.1 hypothetical protein D5R93_03975 [Actinomyces lilanjuaniae]